MITEVRHMQVFRKQRELRNPNFFNRFPDVKYEGRKIVDLGCGQGALTVDMAMKGAEEVVGIDLSAPKIDFANTTLKDNYPDLVDRVTFEHKDVRHLDNDAFDMIVSKAAFEHILDLNELLVHMKNKLRVGSRIVAGFGPLYRSPWGDHNRLKHTLPWTHVLLGERFFIKRLNGKYGRSVGDIRDLGLNGYSLKEYVEMFNNTEGLSVVDFRTNVSDKFSMKCFNQCSHIPFLEEYFTFNVYCQLERTY